MDAVKKVRERFNSDGHNLGLGRYSEGYKDALCDVEEQDELDKQNVFKQQQTIIESQQKTIETLSKIISETISREEKEYER